MKKHALYSPMVTRLIIMVIDGWRWDFVTGTVGKTAMPLTNSLLTNSSGCLLQAKLQSPTVTMPRIKVRLMLEIVYVFRNININLYDSHSFSKNNFAGNDDRYSAEFCGYSIELWQ